MWKKSIKSLKNTKKLLEKEKKKKTGKGNYSGRKYLNTRYRKSTNWGNSRVRRSGLIDRSYKHKHHQQSKRISGVEDKESVKSLKKKLLTQNILKIWATKKRSDLRIIGIEKEGSQIKNPEKCIYQNHRRKIS